MNDNIFSMRIDGKMREFWAPPNGGYIRDVTHDVGTLGPQVCVGLSGMGHALTWRPGQSLAKIIRRERRRELRAIAAQKRQAF
jgi:hypothetical protein